MNKGIVEPSRTIVVVGAGGGIGIEIVKLLQVQARVLAVVQNSAQAEQVLSAGAIRSFECDLIDSRSAALALHSILQACHEQLDGLVICAGVQPAGAAEVIERSELEKVFAVNVFGGFQFVQTLLPSLRRRKGRIVFFSSLAGRLAAPMLGSYCSSKFALEALADVLRREIASSGVSVTLIEPGAVVTAMTAAQPALVEQGIAKLSPAARALYEGMYRGYLGMTQSVMRLAARPEDVARVTCRAVLSQREPRARYVVGKDARIMLLVAKLLPLRWLDALLAKSTRS